MRVLITTGIFPPDIGGPATYSKLLYDELPRAGIEMDVISYGEVRKLKKFVRHYHYMRKVIKGAKVADLIYAQDPVSVGFPSAIASIITGKPLVLKIVGDYAWEQGVQRFGTEELLDDFVEKKSGIPVFVRILNKIERFVASHAKKIIVPSKYLKEVVIKWGVDRKKITVIYNTLNLKELPEKAILRKLLPTNERFIVSAGRLVPWKGFEALIEIMPALRKKYPNINLVIIGSGPLEQSLEKKIKKLDLSKVVRLTGSLDQKILHSYIKMADTFVLNTGYEGFSHQILEAMALGTPVITTRKGGNLEIIEHGRNGLLVDYNNKAELIKAIGRLLRDKPLARRLAKTGLTKTSLFIKEDMIKKTINVLNEGVNA